MKAASTRRTERGSALPVVILSLTLTIAFLVFSADVMRTAHAASVLDFASQSAALAGLSYACNGDGSYTKETAQSNISNAILAGEILNSAPAGPKDGISNSPVRFFSEDIRFIDNPNSTDSGDFLLQVRARRDGDDSLKLFFASAIFAFNSWSGLPAVTETDQVSPYRINEAIAQPASRMGSGPPRSDTSKRGLDLAGWATLPLAISNVDFISAADPRQTNQAYTVDIVQSDQTTYSSPSPGNHIKGCFVNLVSNGSLQYYGNGEGNLAIDQLFHSLEYFSAGSANAIAPAVVERGSTVAGFDPADTTFKARRPELRTKLAALPLNRFYILPVIKTDPQFSRRQEVVGFARLKLISVVDTPTSLSFNVQIGESVAVRNGAFANGLSAIPLLDGRGMPPPIAPFTARTIDPNSGGISTRPRGIAMAPALSPRKITTF